MLEDASDKIDTQQFGNIKGVSTSHYLVSLLNFLHSGAEMAVENDHVTDMRYANGFNLKLCFQA